MDNQTETTHEANPTMPEPQGLLGANVELAGESHEPFTEARTLEAPAVEQIVSMPPPHVTTVPGADIAAQAFNPRTLDTAFNPLPLGYESDKTSAPPEPIEPSVSSDHQTVIDHLKAWVEWRLGLDAKPGDVVPTRNPRAEPTPQIAHDVDV